MITLRDYQQEAIDSIYAYFDDNKGNPLVELPTGAGKSLINGGFIERTVMTWPETRILMLTHVKELIEQNYEKLLTLWPSAPAGIYSASLKRKDKYQNIIFAGIQSIYKKAFEFDKFDLVIIDECQMVPNKTNGTYRKFLADLKIANPNIKIIGLTATPYRLDNGMLTHGEDRIFTDICYQLPIKTLLDRGYLAPVRTRAPKQTLNLSGVKTRGGDFVAADQEKAAQESGFTDSAIDDILAEGAVRKSWLIFCPTVSYAEEITHRLTISGISAEIVTGATPKVTRERILREYKSGHVRALINVDVLTTGFDAPKTDLLVLLRSTKSTSLYVQIIGRGMRTAEGKTDCLVLDFGQNVERHGPIDCVTPPTNKGKKQKGEAPTKECPECREVLLAFARKCTACGHEFPAKPLHEAMASSAAILSEDNKPEARTVDSVTYRIHKKPGKKPSLKVTYVCGIKTFSEWVCLEHSGYAQASAARWWSKRSASMVPHRVDLAIDYIESKGIATPVQIIVQKTGKYYQILECAFGELREAS